MQTSDVNNLAPRIKSPALVGYLVTLALEVGLTAALITLNPYFPLGGYAISSVLVIMLVAYLFGLGPAVLAFVSGLLLFIHYFVAPIGWPPAHTAHQWARITAFLLGTVLVLFATLYLRKARIQIEQLASELEKAYQREHHIAESLQASLLGTPPRRLGRFEFETVYRAALEEARVGGDFYDVFRISEDKIGVVVGDVSGKGLKAAVEVAAAKYSIRMAAYDDTSPAGILEKANRNLFRETDDESFVTAFVGVLSSAEGTLVYANAGHSPAFLWHTHSNKTELLGNTGPLCGITEEIRYGQVTLNLHPGDEMLVGTDGLYEVRRGDGLLGIDGLLELYTNLRRGGAISTEQLIDRVLEACGGDLRDDVALVRVIRVRAK